MYFSLASDFLTGKYRTENGLSKSERYEMVEKCLNDRGFRIRKTLDQVAKQHNSTPAGVALAWLIARPGIAAPIASATSLEQLKDLIESTMLDLGSSFHRTLQSGECLLIDAFAVCRKQGCPLSMNCSVCRLKHIQEIMLEKGILKRIKKRLVWKYQEGRPYTPGSCKTALPCGQCHGLCCRTEMIRESQEHATETSPLWALLSVSRQR